MHIARLLRVGYALWPGAVVSSWGIEMRQSCLLLPIAAILSVCPAFAASNIQVFAPTGAISTQATGINATGTVVGWYFDSQTSGHGFLRDSSGNITTFDVPGTSSGYWQGTFAWAINDVGTVVGSYTTTSSTSFQGFLRDADGNFTTFDIPGETINRDTQGPSGINDAGQIVGIVEGNPGENGFLGMTSSTFSVFTPDAGYTEYVSINSFGLVAGTYADATALALHGFSRDVLGNITTFDVPGAIQTEAGYGTWASSLNERGVIAGSWVDTNFIGHGYVRSSAGAITSFDVPGAASSGGTAINASGTIVGSWYASSARPVFHGFIRYSGGSIATFDGPNQSTRSGQGTLPTAINNRGQICGSFAEANGNWYGFVLTP